MFSCFGRSKPKFNKVTSKFEEVCRKIFEKHYRAKFPSVRPDWLKNQKSGCNLELDGYNKKLKIAFEANGIQHYEYNSHFHSCYDDYTDQVYRDKLKAKLCKKKGIHLIVIPYYITNGSKDYRKTIKKYILSHLP